MPTPINKALYEKAKKKYSSMKHSAYKSGLIVKEYKKNGGKYSGQKPKKSGLVRWYKEDWRTQDGKKTYEGTQRRSLQLAPTGGEKDKIFRPTKRITKDTPKTMSELTKKEKTKAINEKKKKGRVKKY